MLKIILTHSLIKLFSYIINFLTITYLSNYFYKDSVAFYFYLINFFNFGLIFINYGFVHTSQDKIPKLYEAKSNQKIESLISNHLIVIFLNTILLLIICSYFSLFYYDNLFIINYSIFFVVMAINYSWSEILRALRRPYIGQIIIFILYPTLILFFILVFNKNLNIKNEMFVGIFNICSVLSLFVFIILKKNKIKLNIKYISYKNIFFYFKDYFFNFLNSLSFVLITYFFSIIIFKFLSSNDVIYFNLSLMFASIISLPLTFLNINLSSKMSEYAFFGEYSNIKQLAKIASIRSTTISVILLPLVIIFLYNFSIVFFKVNFRDYFLIFTILSIAFTVNVSFGPNQIFMIINGKSKNLALYNLITIFTLSIFFYFFCELNIFNLALLFLVYQVLLNIILALYIRLKFKINFSIF